MDEIFHRNRNIAKKGCIGQKLILKISKAFKIDNDITNSPQKVL